MQAGRASAHAQHNPLPHGAPTEPRLRQGGYRRPAASSISSVLLHSRGRLPRGVCLGGLPALVHSFFAEFLAIPPEVCPSPARPARGVHKRRRTPLRFVSCTSFTNPPRLGRACLGPPSYGPGTHQKTENKKPRYRREKQIHEGPKSIKSGELLSQ